jgi:wobble nucleotide-excising tRNase
MENTEMVTKVLYEFKITTSSKDLNSINAFIGEILQKATRLGVDSVSISINTLKGTIIRKGAEPETKVFEEAEVRVPRKRGRKERVRVADGTNQMKEAIQKFSEEKRRFHRRDLMKLLKEQFKDVYKETTITQKADMIIKDLIKAGFLRKNARGIFEMVTPAEVTGS